MRSHPYYILGAVIGWGKMLRHGDAGWRAQYAKPIAFVRLDDRVETKLRNEEPWKYNEWAQQHHRNLESIADTLSAVIVDSVEELVEFAYSFPQGARWWVPELEEAASEGRR